MRTDTPQTALQAVAWRRLLVSGWPWRSAGYLLTTLPLAVAALAGLAVPAVPWLVLAARMGGSYQAGLIVLLVLLGAAMIPALGPVIAVPLAGLERRRLRMVDTRAVGPVHRTAAADGTGRRPTGRCHGCVPATPSRPPGERSATPACWPRWRRR